jgi:hypothetical protein
MTSRAAFSVAIFICLTTGCRLLDPNYQAITDDGHQVCLVMDSKEVRCAARSHINEHAAGLQKAYLHIPQRDSLRGRRPRRASQSLRGCRKDHGCCRAEERHRSLPRVSVGWIDVQKQRRQAADVPVEYSARQSLGGDLLGQHRDSICAIYPEGLRVVKTP